jgi:hypothetical protein
MPPRRMQQEIVSELAFGLKSDTALLTESIVCGEKAELSEAMSLAAMVESLYITATLESRQLGQVQACFELWAEVARLFDELYVWWIDVRTDDPSIVWLRSRIRHFRELAQDRCELYNVSERERLIYAANREIGLETAFGERSD